MTRFARCSYGCDKEDLTKEQLDEHKMVCRFRMTDCAHCGVQVSMALYTTHVQALCMEVREECSGGCGSHFKRKDLVEHLKTCLCVKEACERCKFMVERRMLAEHAAEVCTRRSVVCEKCGGRVIFDMLGLHKCKEPSKKEEEAEEDEANPPKIANHAAKEPVVKKASVAKRVGGGYALKQK